MRRPPIRPVVWQPPRATPRAKARTGPVPLPTCSLAPANIAAGANSSTSTVTVNVPATSAGLVSPARLRLQPLYALAFPFALLVIRFRSKRTNASKRWLMCASLAMVALLHSACGGRSIHHANSYSVMVTAASDTITRTLQISLTVQ